MSRFDWLSEFLARLHDENVLVRRGLAKALAPAHVLVIDAEDWAKAAVIAAQFGCRWAALWGDEQGVRLILYMVLEFAGDYLALRTRIPSDNPVIPSVVPAFPSADRPERHTHDLLGLTFVGHPDERRWTRHQAWPAHQFPLRREFPAAGQSRSATPPDGDYPFQRVLGGGVYEIPVGPVHAGIIEPGTFAFRR